MKYFLTLLTFLVLAGADNAQSQILLERDDAVSTAAYLNKQKEVIIFCACCKHRTMTRVAISEAEVVPKNEAFMIKLHGVAHDTMPFTEYIDLKSTHVKSGKETISMSEVMRLGPPECPSTINWKTMELILPDSLKPPVVPDTLNPHIRAILDAYDQGPAIVKKSDSTEWTLVSLTYDEANHSFRMVFRDKDKNKRIEVIELSRDLKINRGESEVVLSYKDKEKGFWHTIVNSKGQIEESKKEMTLVVPVLEGQDVREMARHFKKCRK